jgi:hypothetical protein
MWHARELADGIPGATLIHRPTGGHTLLHEIPQVVTEAISSAIAAGSHALAAGSGACDPRASTAKEPPSGDLRTDHCDSAFMASPIEVEERVS